MKAQHHPRPTLKALILLVLALLTIPQGVMAQEQAQDLFQQALRMERVSGDLEEAIRLYQQVVETGDRALGARALIRMAESYEKLGQQGARDAYAQIIEEFGDQTEQVALARERLTAMAPAAVEGRGPVARRLLSGDDPGVHSYDFISITPSPDGRRIAYIDGETGEMRLRDLASGEVQQLASGLPAVWNWSPTWSPDGSRLAFSETSFGSGVASIKIIELTSRTVAAVSGTEVPYSGGVTPGLRPADWSRDGRLLLFTGPGLGIVPVAGGPPTTLSESSTGGMAASFSPDGRFVTFAADEEGNEQVFVQPVGGGAPRRITETPGGNGYPLWSPDGKAIAYQRPDGIWVVPMADGEAAGAPRLAYGTTSTRMALAWTEAGGLYLTQYFDESIPYQLPVDSATGAPGAGIEKLPWFPALTRSFVWSPDMQRIAFRGLGPEIVIRAVDGTSTTSHTVRKPNDALRGLSWPGDGREIRFRSRTFEWGGSVMALDVATGHLRELFPWKAPRWPISMSADGRLTLYQGCEEDPDCGLVLTQTGQPGGRPVAPQFDSDSASIRSFARLSPSGDQFFFSRASNPNNRQAASLWVAASDGADMRRVGTMNTIVSAVWDPSGRFIAYAGKEDSDAFLIRVVEVATGAECGSTPLPDPRWEGIELTDWSPDGRFIGIAISQPRYEYWAVQGLMEGAR